MAEETKQEQQKQCCGDCARCDSPYRLQSMVCASQLSLYNMKMLESLTQEVAALRSVIAMLANSLAGECAIEPAKPADVSSEQAQEGSGATE